MSLRAHRPPTLTPNTAISRHSSLSHFVAFRPIGAASGRKSSPPVLPQTAFSPPKTHIPSPKCSTMQHNVALFQSRHPTPPIPLLSTLSHLLSISPPCPHPQSPLPSPLAPFLAPSRAGRKCFPTKDSHPSQQKVDTCDASQPTGQPL